MNQTTGQPQNQMTMMQQLQMSPQGFQTPSSTAFGSKQQMNSSNFKMFNPSPLHPGDNNMTMSQATERDHTTNMVGNDSDGSMDQS